jgi:predicted DNA-binding transcriptional regulator AlpA
MPRKANNPTAVPVASGNRRLWTRAQAAEYLGVSEATLSRWAAERTGPAFIKMHDGEAGSVRYPSDLLDAFVESRIKQPKQ